MLSSIKIAQLGGTHVANAAKTKVACNGLILSRANSTKVDRVKKDVKLLVEDAMRQYDRLPRSFRNIDTENISFKVHTSGIGSFSQMLYKNRPTSSGFNGLNHVCPWSIVENARMGLRGTMGMYKYGNKRPLTDPSKATMEVTLNTNPRCNTEAINQDMVEYMDWLTNIEQKFLDHILRNCLRYPSIMTRFKDVRITRPLLEKAMFFKNQVASETGTVSRLFADRKLFLMPKYAKKNPEFDSKYEEEVFKKMGLVRNTCHMYDSQLNLISPKTFRPVRADDIVSCRVMLHPVITSSGRFGLNHRLTELTVLFRPAAGSNWRMKVDGGFLEASKSKSHWEPAPLQLQYA